VQTTLLGLAIAFILALVAALVGPFFIDWGQFRSQFEAEATRIVGAPVRVAGALDARLLPAPSLRLHDITVGGANDLGRLRADKLDVEFSLGSLLRGEWRATELTVGGAAVDLGLDAQGRIDLPASTGSFNLGALAIDRLNVTGRIVLHDAASRSTLELSDIAFSGDVRSLAAGAVRGDGNFMLSGTRRPFRISSGQTGDGGATRLRLVIDATEKSVGADLDGVVAFDHRVPSFEGALTMAGAAGARTDNDQSDAPWRIVSKVKADPSRAQFESIDVSYGTEDAGLKLAGVADLRFGASPLLHAVLSAKQLDADRLLARQDGGNVTPVTALRRLAGIVPHPPLPTQVEVSAEQITLGGRPIRNAGADLHGDTASWALERLEFRAPGATRVIASGAAQSGAAGGFAGAINIESADPDMLAAWLKGRNDAQLRDPKPLRIRGNFTSGADRFAIDHLKAEIDGGSLEGRVSLDYPSNAGASRIDAELKADRLDLDAAAALIRSLGGSQNEWPEAGRLSLDVDHARSGGQEIRSFAAQVVYDPKSVSLSRFKVGDATGVMLDGNGAFDRTDATGKFALRASVPSLPQLGTIIAPFAPGLADRLGAMPGASGAATLRVALDLTRAQGKPDRAGARLVLDIDAPQVKGDVTVVGALAVIAMRNLDIAALSRGDVSIESRLTGQGRSLLALLGLNGMVAAGDAPLQFEANASGGWYAPMRVKAGLSGDELDADIQGSVEPWAQATKAAVTLAVRNADIAPLLGLRTDDAFAQKVKLSSRLSLDGEKLSLDDIDSTVAGSRMRGRLALTLGADKSIDGELGADRLELGPMFGWLIGAHGHDVGEPLGEGRLRGWRGQLAFQALQATLPGGSELRPVSGTIRSDGRAITVDAIKGRLGDGEFIADVDLKPSPAAGYGLSARVELSGADSSALRYRGLAMPAGKASVKASIASQGRSVSALEGAVSGSGLVTIDNLRIRGFDPHVLDAAIRASDSGQATDDAKLRQIVERVLAQGEFATGAVQIPFNVKDSRLRINATTLEAEGGRAIVSGGYDIVADQADIRASLAGAAAAGSNARPDIQVYMTGTPDRLERTIDVSALSSWLAVRAIDRETRRLDSLEHGSAQPVIAPAAVPPASGALPPETPPGKNPPTPAAPDLMPSAKDPRRPSPRTATPRPAAAPPVVSQHIAPLPAPIEVRPAPGAARTQPKPRPAAPLVLTPPATAPSARSAF